MNLNEALALAKARSGKGRKEIEFLACGFEPLHLATLLRACLLERSPESDVVLETGVYGDVDHIAYPLGGTSDCSDREFRMAAEIGFISGYTTKRGNLNRDDRNRLLSLRRHTLSMAPHSRNVRYLRVSLAGIWNSPLNGTIVTR